MNYRHKAYTSCDSEIVSIQGKLEYLKYVNPSNYAVERVAFMKSLQNSEVYHPVFQYHPPSPSLLNDIEIRLNSVHVPETVPELHSIYRGAICHSRSVVKLLQALGTNAFHSVACDVFGATQTHIHDIATCHLGDRYLGTLQHSNSPEQLDCSAAIKFFQRALDKMGLDTWQIHMNVPGAPPMVRSYERLVLLNQQLTYDLSTLEALVAHEIEGHAMQSHRASELPLRIFAEGFGRYELLSEGHALLCEYAVNPHVFDRISLYYLATTHAAENGFYETFSYLLRWLNRESAYALTARVKRGLTYTEAPGALMKDLAYLEGFLYLRSLSKSDRELVACAKFDPRFFPEMHKLCTWLITLTTGVAEI